MNLFRIDCRLAHPAVRATWKLAGGASEYGRVAARLKDIEEVGVMVSAIESDGKGVPVLLRHYLRLNATILSFKVGRNFNGVLESLIFVWT